MKDNRPTLHPLSFKFKVIVLLSTTLVTLILDQWSKFWAAHYLKFEAPHTFLGGTVKFIYAENRGAWGSLGSNWPEAIRWPFLMVLPLVILLSLAVYILLYRLGHKAEVVGLCLIVAGGLGNLIDRFRFNYVIDMFWMGFPQTIWQTNIFNVADMVIMAGFGLLLGINIADWRKKVKNQKS